MKTLIVYYSFSQNNEKLANRLRQRLNCSIARIETVKKRNGFSILFDLIFKRKPALKPIPQRVQEYDHVIFIAPIWAGKIAMPIKSFMIDHKTDIRSYSFITFCGGGNPNQKGGIRKELTDTLTSAPLCVEELWATDVLIDVKRDKGVTAFRIHEGELDRFESKIAGFVSTLEDIMLKDAEMSN